MQCCNGTKVSGLFMADLCWAGSYPAVKGLWLPYTHDAKIFLGILVSVISFRYMNTHLNAVIFKSLVRYRVQFGVISQHFLLFEAYETQVNQRRLVHAHCQPSVSQCHPFSEDMWYHYMVTDLVCLELMSPKNLFLCLLSIYLTTLLWGNVIADIFQIN